MLDNALPKDIPRLEQTLMSLPEITPENIVTLQKNDTFCNSILHHLHCSKKKITSQMPWAFYTKNIIDFNSTFLSVVVPKILIKYLLHTFYDSLGHVGANKLYHFLKRLYSFQGKWKIIHKYIRTCQNVKL